MIPAATTPDRQRSRSPARRWPWQRHRGSSEHLGGSVPVQDASVPKKQKLPECRPEDKMHKWAQKSGRSDASRVNDLMETMQIADFEKYKTVSVFKCPAARVSEKMRKELDAKKFPKEMIEAVVDGVEGLTFYEKCDTHFEHSSKASERGKSKLYQYALWCRSDDEGLMDVSLWCITTNFRKGSTGTATKNEIEGLKQFMEQETCADVLQMIPARQPLAGPNALGSQGTDLTPEKNMIQYAKVMQTAHQSNPLHEDELINRMEISAFTKYKTNTSFRCPRDIVTSKVRSELEAKKFPGDVVESVTEGIADMEYCKKLDENFIVHTHDGLSKYYKYAIWCSARGCNDMEVSMLCIAADFKKKSDGPATKSEIEVLAQYLGHEACTDVLRVHDPDNL